MEITTSQSKTQEVPAKAEPTPGQFSQSDDRYMDRSDDLVARVRAAREAAQRRMDAFGNVSEYQVRVVRSRKSEPQG